MWFPSLASGKDNIVTLQAMSPEEILLVFLPPIALVVPDFSIYVFRIFVEDIFNWAALAFALLRKTYQAIGFCSETPLRCPPS